MSEATKIRTVAELIAALQQLDPTLPVGEVVYGPNRTIVGPVAVTAMQMRRGCAELEESFSGRPNWFTLGTPQAQWHEERGGQLETVAVIEAGP